MKEIKNKGQWLWLNWYSGCFQHQSSAAWMQSSANFIYNKLYWRDKNKEKEAGMAHLKSKEQIEGEREKEKNETEVESYFTCFFLLHLLSPSALDWPLSVKVRFFQNFDGNCQTWKISNWTIFGLAIFIPGKRTWVKVLDAHSRRHLDVVH